MSGPHSCDTTDLLVKNSVPEQAAASVQTERFLNTVHNHHQGKTVSKWRKSQTNMCVINCDCKHYHFL